MPIHDWTRVPSGIFHHFHGMWIPEVCKALNAGVLPADYYALIDQVTGRASPDVLTLSHPSSRNGTSHPTAANVSAVATTPPKARFYERAVTPTGPTPKSVVIRHISDDRIVAMIEIVSRGNKASTSEFDSFVDKSVALIQAGVHLLVVDLFPPGPRDPDGIHLAIWTKLSETDFEPSPDQPLTFASYAAGVVPEAFVNLAAVGDPVPEMPLFLTPETYVNVPLEAPYMATWAEVPRRWRQVIDPAAA